MHDDRADARIHAREDALRLAEAVAHQEAGATALGIAAPPSIDVVEDLLLRQPAVDGQPEGRFGDEAVAANGLKGSTGVVVVAGPRDEVIARRDPHPTTMFKPHLRRAEHVARRMQAQPHPVVLDDLAILQSLKIDVRPETRTQHAFGRRRREVVRAARARVVAVRMRNHRPIHRPPRIDEEIARRAIKPFWPFNDQISHRRQHRPSSRQAPSSHARDWEALAHQARSAIKPRPRSRLRRSARWRPLGAGAKRLGGTNTFRSRPRCAGTRGRTTRRSRAAPRLRHFAAIAMPRPRATPQWRDRTRPRVAH